MSEIISSSSSQKIHVTVSARVQPDGGGERERERVKIVPKIKAWAATEVRRLLGTRVSYRRSEVC